MLNINFDFFYELKQGSIISITHPNPNLGIYRVQYFRMNNNVLEAKLTDPDTGSIHDWHECNYISFHADCDFKIEERFPRNNNG